MTGALIGSDADFLVALAATALLIAGVVLIYIFVTYRRARDAERRSQRAAETLAAAARLDREPVFFKRYEPEEETVNREP